jgi:hypothetical protein
MQKKATVEAATYGVKSVTTRIAIDQIVDLHLLFTLYGYSCCWYQLLLFGDNQLVFLSQHYPIQVAKNNTLL